MVRNASLFDKELQRVREKSFGGVGVGLHEVGLVLDDVLYSVSHVRAAECRRVLHHGAWQAWGLHACGEAAHGAEGDLSHLAH